MNEVEKAKIKIRLEQIKVGLQENRQPQWDNGGFLVAKNPTLAEWAVEEVVCLLLDILQEESEPCGFFGEVQNDRI